MKMETMIQFRIKIETLILIRIKKGTLFRIRIKVETRIQFRIKMFSYYISKTLPLDRKNSVVLQLFLPI
jgi:hypothetical protein